MGIWNIPTVSLEQFLSRYLFPCVMGKPQSVEVRWPHIAVFQLNFAKQKSSFLIASSRSFWTFMLTGFLFMPSTSSSNLGINFSQYETCLIDKEERKGFWSFQKRILKRGRRRVVKILRSSHLSVPFPVTPLRENHPSAWWRNVSLASRWCLLFDKQSGSWIREQLKAIMAEKTTDRFNFSENAWIPGYNRAKFFLL